MISYASKKSPLALPDEELEKKERKGEENRRGQYGGAPLYASLLSDTRLSSSYLFPGAFVRCAFSPLLTDLTCMKRVKDNENKTG